MWAVTSYYNPARFKRRLANYKTFRANLAVPLVTVELSFDGNFELGDGDADILIQISGGAVLWQKERLLNLAIKLVPSDAENVAWIDCDVIFERTDWMDEAELQLKKLNIVHLFSEVVDLDPEGYRSKVKDFRPTGCSLISIINGQKLAQRSDGARMQIDAAMSSWGTKRTPEEIRSFPVGMAWAARKALIEAHGLYDALIIGGGDRAMLLAMYGQFDKEKTLHCLNVSQEEHYLRWARPYYRAVAGKIGNVSGRIYHLWHGDVVKRNYAGRHRLLAGFDFEPDLDLAIGPEGAWQWARSRPELQNFLLDYFHSRAEDE